MNKKYICVYVTLIIMFLNSIICAPKLSLANSAEPIRGDKGSGIVFKQNEKISIEKELLNIKINGYTAEISANYTMKNNCSENLHVESMFLSPVINNFDGESFNRNYKVTKNDIDLPLKEEFFLPNDYNVSFENLDKWESILAQKNQQVDSLGEKSGFKLYTFKVNDDNIKNSPNIVDFYPTEHYFVYSNGFSKQNNKITLTTFSDDILVISRENLNFTTNLEKITEDIPDIYEYLYEKGKFNDEKLDEFSRQEFNLYLAKINLNSDDLLIKGFFASMPYRYVSSVSYFIDFKPLESLELKVSYNYRLSQSGKNKAFNYYLTPARYWKDFSSLTIKLEVDKNASKIVDSNLKFVQISDNVYEFYSSKLPSTELKIIVGKKGAPSIDIDTFINIVGNVVLIVLITTLAAVIIIKIKCGGIK